MPVTRASLPGMGGGTGTQDLISRRMGTLGTRLGGASRVFHGATARDPLDYWNDDIPREVLIPPGLCVYFWLGCESPRWRRNYCFKHYQETRAEETFTRGHPAKVPQPFCVEPGCARKSTYVSERCRPCGERKRKREYAATHRVEEKARRDRWRESKGEDIASYEKEWRKANPGKSAEYGRRYRAKLKERAATVAA